MKLAIPLRFFTPNYQMLAMILQALMNQPRYSGGLTLGARTGTHLTGLIQLEIRNAYSYRYRKQELRSIKFARQMTR